MRILRRFPILCRTRPVRRVHPIAFAPSLTTILPNGYGQACVIVVRGPRPVGLATITSGGLAVWEIGRRLTQMPFSLDTPRIRTTACKILMGCDMEQLPYPGQAMPTIAANRAVPQRYSPDQRVGSKDSETGRSVRRLVLAHDRDRISLLDNLVVVRDLLIID